MDKMIMDDKFADDSLTFCNALAYASPMVITAFLLYPIQLLLGPMYAKYFGLPLTTIATIILAARFFDAITDPLIGFLSDWHRSKVDTRKPWVVVGGISLIASSFFLFMPPDNVSAIYFLCWYFVFYIAWTVVDIPHLAWGGELSSCSQEKTKIYSLRATCVFLGLALYTLVPMLPFFGDQGFTPETLKWSVIVSAVVIIPVLVLCVKFAPNGRPCVKSKKEKFTLIFGSIIRNKPLVTLIGGYFFIGIAGGMYLSMTYIFTDTYLGIGEKLPLIFSVSILLGLVTTVMIYNLTKVVNKVTIYSCAVLASILSLLGMALLSPGPDSFLPFIGLTAIFTCGNASMVAIVPAILSDASDYGTWKFSADRTATYFASYTILVKACFGIGSAFGFGVVGWYGLDITSSVHSNDNIFGLHLAAIYIPALMFAFALPFVIKTPIDTRRHRIIQRRIVERLQRLERKCDLEAV